MSRETIGIVQYMTNKGTWENVPLYKKDNELVYLWLSGGDIYDHLQEYSYNIESGDATALNEALGFYEDDDPDDCPEEWKAVHLATLRYLSKDDVTSIFIDIPKLSDKVEVIAELAGIYATIDQIRLVYYLDC